MGDLLEAKVSLRLWADKLSPECVGQLRARWDGNLQFHPDGAITLTLKSQDQVPEIAAFIIAQGARLFELSPARETLESAFLRIVGEEGPLSQPS